MMLAVGGMALLFSLLPAVTFTIASSSRPDTASVLSPVYPGHGVPQELEHFGSPVVSARIWVAAGLDGPPVLVSAALVSGLDGGIIRQLTFEAAPSFRPVAKDLVFPAYDQPDGPLTLQLSVVPEAENFISLGIAGLDSRKNGDFKQVTLNGDPLSYLGPLAHEFQGQGSGLRAALFQGGPDRLRLAFALAALMAGGAVGLAGTAIGRALLRTALRPFLPASFEASFKPAYSWWQPTRTLATFEFLKGVPRDGGSVFTFGHVIKSHVLYSFDRFGNVSDDSEQGFGADHDPGVSEPYFGQLIYINNLVLETVDAILARSEITPIIVISADHGRRDQPGDPINSIFAAYLLPDDGNDVLYPSISSVNSFRVVLDYYFNLDHGLLEDRSYQVLDKSE
jgi:hypothetical protein